MALFAKATVGRVRCLFVGFAVPTSILDQISRTEKYPQVAANKFQWSLIDGLEAAAGAAVDLVSSVPVGTFPQSAALLVRGKRWKHRVDSDDAMIGFINLVGLKQLTKVITCFTAIVRWLARNRAADQRLIVYAMHTPHVLAAWIGARIAGASVVLIIPDLPKYMDVGIGRSCLRRVAKTADHWLMMRMLLHMDGLVVLTEAIARDFAPSIPFVVIEGAVGEGARPPGPYTSAKIIMYAGALTTEYGIDLLLEAFALIPDEAYQLWIAGRGEREHDVLAHCARDSRITYLGFRSNSEIAELESIATVLVNARRSSAAFTRYSFPSKLLEYMSAGRPVITTDLVGIPPDYRPYVHVLTDETPQGLATLICRVANRGADDLEADGNRARAFVQSQKSALRQGERLWSFLQRVDELRRPRS